MATQSRRTDIAGALPWPDRGRLGIRYLADAAGKRG